MHNLCYHPPDSPQSFKGVKTVRQALDRIERFLAAMALDATPERIELSVNETQTEALMRATRTRAGDPDPDSAAAYAASGQQQPELARQAEAILGPGERRVFGSGWTGDMWITRWTTWPEREGFAADSAAIFDFADAHFGAPKVVRYWEDRDDPKRHDPALTLTAYWKVRWKDPATGAPLPTQWDEANTLWLHVGAKPQFSLDVAFPFEDVDADFANFVFAVEKNLGAGLKDKRIKIRHGDPARHSWGFWLTSFDREKWA
ncbi:MAG: hypothetical protein H6747_11220 [Deltaproteobacteria bacterium]|nr:hypothetical protein [Deltaproteobacteria bacterium]